MQPIIVARFGAPHGISGDLRLHSFTEDPNTILKFKPLMLNHHNQWQVLADDFSVRPHGQTFLARIPGVASPEAARTYVNCYLGIQREQLPGDAEDVYYHCDLQGLSVINLDQVFLGQVDHVLSTGANDVLVIRKPQPRMIPFVKAYVQHVDLAAAQVLVDWDPSW